MNGIKYPAYFVVMGGLARGPAEFFRELPGFLPALIYSLSAGADARHPLRNEHRRW